MPNPKFDALVWRDLYVALDHRRLDFNGAVHGVDDTAELDDAAVARAFDDATVMHRNSRVGQVASKGPEPSEDAILIRARKPRITNEHGGPRSRPVSGFRPLRPLGAPDN